MFNFRTFKCFADDTNVSGGGVTESPLEPKTRVEYFLNKIAEAVSGEGGGSGGSSSGPLIVNIVEDESHKKTSASAPTYRFDKTAAEVYSALTTTGCVVVYDGGISQIIYGTYKKNSYLFPVWMDSGNENFIALNADDYPVVGD